MLERLKVALSSFFEPSMEEEATLGHPGLASHKYVFGLAYEKGKTSLANRKYRCLIMREDQLETLANLDASLVDLVSVRRPEYKEHRLDSLKQLHTPGWRHVCAYDSGSGSSPLALTL